MKVYSAVLNYRYRYRYRNRNRRVIHSLTWRRTQNANTERRTQTLLITGFLKPATTEHFMINGMSINLASFGRNILALKTYPQYFCALTMHLLFESAPEMYLNTCITVVHDWLWCGNCSFVRPNSRIQEKLWVLTFFAFAHHIKVTTSMYSAWEMTRLWQHNTVTISSFANTGSVWFPTGGIPQFPSHVQFEFPISSLLSTGRDTHKQGGFKLNLERFIRRDLFEINRIYNESEGRLFNFP